MTTAERGSGTFLMVGVSAVLMVLALAGVVAAGYLTALHRARSSADLAALSGAAVAQRGGDSCGSAAEVAEANGVRMIACERVGDQLDFVVTVRVACDLRAPSGLPRSVEAIAYAGLESEP
jgi:secretion/DNA translocation related TadE-like protein